MIAVIKDTRVSAVLAGPYNHVVTIATHYWYITSTTGIISIVLDTARETKWRIAVSSNNFPPTSCSQGCQHETDTERQITDPTYKHTH